MIDTSYSFFTCPDLEDIPAPTMSKQQRHAHATMVLRKESTRMSQPDVVAYMPPSATSNTNATASMTREEWITDTTYGYFDCPSLHPEPMMHHKANTTTAARRSTTPPPQLRCTNDDDDEICQDGYSFFGI